MTGADGAARVQLPQPEFPATTVAPGAAPGWVRAVLQAGVDDAGFAVLTADVFSSSTRPLHPETMLGLLGGHGRTATLPAAAAVAVVERVAATDPGLASRIAEGDDRRAVVGALERGAAAFTSATETVPVPSGTFSELAGRLDTLVARWLPRHWADPEVLDVLRAAAPVEVVELCVAAMCGDVRFAFASGDDERQCQDAAAVLAGVLAAGVDVARFASLLGECHRFVHASPQHAAAVTLATFAAGDPDAIGGCFSGSRDVVLAAFEMARRPLTHSATGELSQAERSTARVAMLGWLAVDDPSCVEGPGSLAEVAGITKPLASAPTEAVWGLCSALASSELTPPECLAAVLTAATASGAVFRPTPTSALQRCGDLLEPETCFAVVAAPDSSIAARASRRWFLLVPAAKWPPDRFAACFDAEPGYASLLLAELVAMCLDGAVPAPDPLWVNESMRRTGLEYWVRLHPRSAARLASAAAGVGVDRWATVVSLLGSFHGTPEELVTLSGELAPHAAPPT